VLRLGDRIVAVALVTASMFWSHLTRHRVCCWLVGNQSFARRCIHLVPVKAFTWSHALPWINTGASCRMHTQLHALVTMRGQQRQGAACSTRMGVTGQQLLTMNPWGAGGGRALAYLAINTAQE
jgi:hypothetical protein